MNTHRALFSIALFITFASIAGCGGSSPKRATLIKEYRIPYLQSEGGKGISPSLHYEGLAVSPEGDLLAYLLFPTRFNAELMVVDKSGNQLASYTFKDCFVDVLSLSRYLPLDGINPLILWADNGDKLLISLNHLKTGGKIGTYKAYILSVNPPTIVMENSIDGVTTLYILQEWNTKEGSVLFKKIEKDSTFLFEPSGKQTDKESIDLLLGEYKRGKVSLMLMDLTNPSNAKTISIKNFHLGIGDWVVKKGNDIFIVEEGLKGKVRIWQVDLNGSEQLFREFTFPEQYVCQSMPSPDMRHILVICADFTSEQIKSFLQVIDLRDGKTKRTIENGVDESLFPICWAPDNRFLVLLRERYEGKTTPKQIEQSLLLLDSENGSEQEITLEKGKFTALSWLRDCKELFFLTRTEDELYLYSYSLPPKFSRGKDKRP